MVMVVSSTPLPLQYHPHRLLLDTNNHGNNGTGGGGGGGNTYTDDGNFDSNMVIILAALLCALICALGLNSIVRFAIRCSHRLVAFDTPHQASVLRLAAATGLHKQALNDIPVVVYGSSSSSGFNTSITIPATDCPICLSEFADGDKVRILPNCNHGFHVNCIDTWFTSRSSCPICRRPLGCDEVTSSSSSTTVPVLEEEEEEAAVDVSVRSPANGTSEEPHGFVIITVVNHDEVS